MVQLVWLRVLLKQTQPRIIVRQHVSTMCMDVERNQDPPPQLQGVIDFHPIKDDKYFWYIATVTLNHEIGIKLQRISKIKPFMNKYYKKGINYPSTKDEWKKFEKIIQLLLLICYILKNNHIFCLISKYNSNQE